MSFENRNERGFGLVGLLVLLPFLLSVIATIAAAAVAFKADAHLKHECRVSVLKSQREAAGKLKELMRLNSRASSLRKRYRIAQNSLRAAQATGLPVLIAPAQANVAAVHAMRIVLAAQQNALILEGKGLSYAAPSRAKSAVLGGLAKEVSMNRVRRPATRTTSRMGRFNVKASPKGDLTPDYNPADTFTKDQVVDLDVTIDAASLLPEWLRRLLPDGKLQISSHCQATIEKQENTWVETLNAVR